MSGVERLLMLIFLYILKRFSDHGDSFATKTSYFSVANLDDSPLEVEGCSPEMIWFLARHGTRNPSKVGWVKYLPTLKFSHFRLDCVK